MQDIPDGVRATVLERVRRLDPSERGILMRASVIGNRFEIAVLLATTPRTESRVRAALARAVEVALIVAEDVAAGRYAFTHALTRDIIYTELLTMRVRPIHRRIVRALERACEGDRPIEKLAYHSWAGGDARRCLRYNEGAGDVAASLHAWDDARAAYRRARGAARVGSRSYLRIASKLAALDAPLTK